MNYLTYCVGYTEYAFKLIPVVLPIISDITMFYAYVFPIIYGTYKAEMEVTRR